MQEDFLHYIWKFQKYNNANLLSESGSAIQIIKVGEHNTLTGPDFFNAQLIIENQKWAGNVEIHLKSSDWYAHHHEKDSAYDNIILHVVWEDDIEVFNKNNIQLETLVLKDKVDISLVHQYQKLLHNQNWIPCEKSINAIDNFTWGFWKEKLLVNRLQRKAVRLTVLYERLNKNWEALLFVLLVQGFGLKINQDQFLKLAESIGFFIFKKEMSSQLSLEALLFGQSNLLLNHTEDGYYEQLRQEYLYLKQKHQLTKSNIQLAFYGLRPPSFPTLRLSQLASLYHQNHSLFAKVIAIKSIEQARELFTVMASEYWNTHYTFGKTSSKRIKKLTPTFISLIMINVVLPLQYQYAKYMGEDNFEDVLKMYQELKPEKNSISEKFKKMNVIVESAFDSQALIELKNEFCKPKKCLQCQIGHQILYPKQK